MKTPSPYSKNIMQRIKAAAKKQVKDCRSVRHIFPRAYCVAKPAPGCAVFAIPWQDAEKQVRKPEYSSSETVWQNAQHVQVGEWRSLAYLSSPSFSETCVIDL